jgi:integrase
VELGPIWQDSEYIFTDIEGRPLDPIRVSKTFAKIIKALGLTGVLLHDLRHTHASLMLQSGVHPKVVSERLDHASINITLDTYSHVLPGVQDEAAERFAKLLAQGGQTLMLP